MDSIPELAQYVVFSELTADHKRLTDAFILQDLNRSTEIQYPLLGHIFTFSTIAVKKKSTFQWIQY